VFLFILNKIAPKFVYKNRRGRGCTREIEDIFNTVLLFYPPYINVVKNTHFLFIIGERYFLDAWKDKSLFTHLKRLFCSKETKPKNDAYAYEYAYTPTHARTPSHTHSQACSIHRWKKMQFSFSKKGERNRENKNTHVPKNFSIEQKTNSLFRADLF